MGWLRQSIYLRTKKTKSQIVKVQFLESIIDLLSDILQDLSRTRLEINPLCTVHSKYVHIPVILWMYEDIGLENIWRLAVY